MRPPRQRLIAALGQPLPGVLAHGVEHQEARAIVRITGPDIPAMPFSPPLEKAWQLNTDKILAGMQKLAA